MKWCTKEKLVGDRVDPYFEWAELTQWRGFRRLSGQRLGTGDTSITRVRVLVQAKDADLARTAMDARGWKVADVYKKHPSALRHFVAELSLDDVDALERLSDPDLSWELALPLRDADTVARAQDIGAYGETRQATDFRPEQCFDIDAPKGKTPPVEKPVIAVIDFGCPFMNEAFLRQDGTTRVEALWDQGASRVPPILREDGSQPPWPWADARRMGYGREMRRPTMNKILKACRGLGDQGEPLDEAEAYRRIDYLIDYDDARRRIWNATHGSHVLGVAAGNPDPLQGTGREPDLASSAPLVFVQLPSLTAADSSGASLSAQVLDAVHYVLDVCGPAQAIVVVLSYGSFAGPHDGSSLIEQALDELVRLRKQNLAIVLGAGNGHQAACHVRRGVRVDRSALLRVRLDDGDLTDTYVESWFEPNERLLGRVRARARTADGDWSDWIGVGESVRLHVVDDARPVACLSLRDQVPNGARPLLLFAMAPTTRPADDDGPLAPAGSWQIELMLEPLQDQPDDPSEVLFDAWIERDDPGWLGHGVQPRFEEQQVGDDEQTLNSLATGRYTIAAGGFRISDRTPASYSSSGQRLGPDLVYAACEESADQPNIRSTAVRSQDALRMNGTSVAAPVLGRRIYNRLAQGKAHAVRFDRWEKALTEIIEDEAARDQGRAPVLLKPRSN